MTTSIRPWLATLAAVSIVGLLAGPCVAAAPAGVRVQQAWIRWLPAGLPAGGYVTLVNGSDQPVQLIGAASVDYGQIQLHRTLTQQGMSKMSPVAAVRIPAHSTLSFEAQGYHLMLMHPRRMVMPGDHVQIELRFAGGAAIVASFEVRKPDASGDGGMANMPGMSH
jgi:copper(I)-binding protein